MRILILGTSNSILKQGWTSGLREALHEAEIVNLSVGASPGTQFGRYLDMDFAQYDLVFFDSVVNEENLGSSVGSEEFVTQLIFQIISSIAAKTRVIVLGFSNERHLHDPSFHYCKREKIAASCGGQFISMMNLVREHGHKLSKPDEGLFTDNGTHIRYDLQKHIGFLIGQVLLDDLTALPLSLPTPNFSSCFIYEDLAKNLTPEQKIVKSNQLMTLDFARLKNGEAWHFSNLGLCLGFYVAVDATQCIVAMHGGGETKWKDLWYSLDELKFQLKFVPIKDGFTLQTLKLASSANELADVATVERSIHSSFRKNLHLNFNDSQLLLTGALFWIKNDYYPQEPDDTQMARSRLLEKQVERLIAAPTATA